VRQLVHALDAKERDVICRRYGIEVDAEQGTVVQVDEGATLEQLAQALGVSRERIRQIEREALRKMRRAYGATAKRREG